MQTENTIPLEWIEVEPIPDPKQDKPKTKTKKKTKRGKTAVVVVLRDKAGPPQDYIFVQLNKQKNPIVVIAIEHDSKDLTLRQLNSTKTWAAKQGMDFHVLSVVTGVAKGTPFKYKRKQADALVTNTFLEYIVEHKMKVDNIVVLDQDIEISNTLIRDILSDGANIYMKDEKDEIAAMSYDAAPIFKGARVKEDYKDIISESPTDGSFTITEV